jgi:hypothetical protein
VHEHKDFNCEEENVSQLEMPPTRRRRIMPQFQHDNHFGPSEPLPFDQNLLGQIDSHQLSMDREQFGSSLGLAPNPLPHPIGLSAPATPTHNYYGFLTQPVVQAATPTTNSNFADAFHRQISEFDTGNGTRDVNHSGDNHHNNPRSQEEDDDNHFLG